MTLRRIWTDRGAGTLVEALDALEGWTGREGRGHVLDSFWSAWDAFAGAGSYRDAVIRAVQYGQDTDTTAAIAGGLAGVYWGIDGIPPDWIAGLREPGIVRPLVDRLIASDGWRTSTSHPLRVDQLDLRGVVEPASKGRVGLTFLPGKQRDGWTGKHWRDLTADVARLADAWAVDRFVLFVEDLELTEARVARITGAFDGAGVELVRFPISDGAGLPRDDAAYHALIREALALARSGGHVVFACRGGLDRTGTAAGCLLVEGGLDPEEAIRRVHAARRSTLTRSNQQASVRAWEA